MQARIAVPLNQTRIAHRSNWVVRRHPRLQRACYLRDADALVVLDANAGAERTPAWWLNLEAAGEAEVLIGRRRLRVRPRVIAGAERDRLWRRFVEMYPQAAQYTRFTDRNFSLIALEPA
jgi:F420H(2)-dependent quinone reductase